MFYFYTVTVGGTHITPLYAVFTTAKAATAHAAAMYPGCPVTIGTTKG